MYTYIETKEVAVCRARASGGVETKRKQTFVVRPKKEETWEWNLHIDWEDMFARRFIYVYTYKEDK
jgi:hypothetical protein